MKNLPDFRITVENGVDPSLNLPGPSCAANSMYVVFYTARKVKVKNTPREKYQGNILVGVLPNN